MEEDEESDFSSVEAISKISHPATGRSLANKGTCWSFPVSSLNPAHTKDLNELSNQITSNTSFIGQTFSRVVNIFFFFFLLRKKIMIQN